jgi:hypothetical protein
LYSSFLADLGTRKLWPLSNVPRGVRAEMFVPVTLDLVAGQTYYVKVVPVEQAKTKGEILSYKKLE